MRRLLTTLICLCFITSYAQQSNGIFSKTTALAKDQHQVASKYESYALDQSKLRQFVTAAPERETFTILFEGRQLLLNLTRNHAITTANLIVNTQNGQGTVPVGYTPGIFYHGSIEGLPKSFVALSFFNNQVMGLISDAKSNIVFGAVENNGVPTSEYMAYRESDLLVANPNNCFTKDDLISAPTLAQHGASVQNRTSAVGEPVELYFECDYALYQNKGNSVNNVINYVLGFFNGVAQLYANENILVQVSQINVWTAPDPYVSYTTTSTLLPVFAAAMATSTYVGDYAHFLSTRNLGGGVAYRLDNPCASGRQYRTAVSQIYSTYSNVPTYSWTVEVVTHETGHNLGSPHTHWCGWVGGAIDNCYATEIVGGIGCPSGPAPVNGGTIMSYCHLTSAGINFNNGFGTQPGDKIRSIVGSAACFSTCKMTVALTSNNATCNLANASASVTASNGTGAYSYLWSNGQTTQTLTAVAAGSYFVTVTDAANCQVMKQAVITSTAGLSVTTSPTAGSIASFCLGGSLELSTTNNTSYTYQWYKDNVLINGATNYNYVAAVAGNYHVVVTASAGCTTTTAAIQVIQSTTAVTASVLPAAPAPICIGSTVALSTTAVTGYTYQWYNNNVAVSGATASTYNAAASGNYTVKVNAGTCSATSQQVVVSVSPAPISNISFTGIADFCQGKTVTLYANLGTGLSYKWYRNSVLISGATQATYDAGTGGSYTLEVSNGGCSALSSPVLLNMLPSPIITVAPANITILKFNTASVTAAGGSTYNWAAQPDVVSSAGNSAVFKPLVSNSYNIMGTNSNDCTNTALLKISVIGCGSVTNIDTFKVSSTILKFTWANPTGAATDSFQYRIAGTSNWTSVYTDKPEITIANLLKATTYEYRIIPLCGAITNVASGINTVTTPNYDNGISIKLMPNPVSTIANLEVINSNAYTLQINVYTAAGHKVLGYPKENLPAGLVTKKINVHSLTDGVYFIAVQIDGDTHTKKMIVKR